MPSEIVQTRVFARWLQSLRDRRAVQRIAERVRRLSLGHFGDHRSVGAGVSELRIDYGPGYRLYYTLKGAEIVILLCGGDKSNQQRDIARAHAMMKDLP